MYIIIRSVKFFGELIFCRIIPSTKIFYQWNFCDLWYYVESTIILSIFYPPIRQAWIDVQLHMKKMIFKYKILSSHLPRACGQHLWIGWELTKCYWPVVADLTTRVCYSLNKWTQYSIYLYPKIYLDVVYSTSTTIIHLLSNFYVVLAVWLPSQMAV